MICSDIGFPDLELLQMGVENVTSSVKDMRETYSFLVLILIYPFRTIDDLKDNKNGLFWTKFVTLRYTHLSTDVYLLMSQI